MDEKERERNRCRAGIGRNTTGRAGYVHIMDVWGGLVLGMLKRDGRRSVNVV